MSLDALSLEQAAIQIIDLAMQRQRGYVCLCNVHSLVTAQSNLQFRQSLESAALCLPDGAPVAWRLRRLGLSAQQRVAGPDLMQQVISKAQQPSLSIFFFGSTEETIGLLTARITRQYPGVRIAGFYCPPLLAVPDGDIALHAKLINESAADIVFVALGCPKQEQWMYAATSSISAPLIGVGAAFDFMANTLPRAPLWMQKCWLEWLHRMVHEPRRLARRYLLTNIVFVYLVLRGRVRRASAQLNARLAGLFKLS